MKLSLMIARFPFFNQENPDLTDWLIELLIKIKTNPKLSNVIGDIYREKVDDTPIPVSRNRIMATAQRLNVDLLLMLDSDIVPDVGLWPRYQTDGAKPFFETALDFMLNHNGPCVCAAPYCGPPPKEFVYVFQACRNQADNPNFDFRLEMIDRESATARTGIEQVPAIATGVMLIDMRATANLRHPYFDYEYEGDGAQCPTCGHCVPGPRTQRSSTEDVYFSRNAWLAGVPQYCLWDSWAGHWKRKLVRKPEALHLDQIASQYQEAILRGQRSREKLLFRDGQHPTEPLVWKDGQEGRPALVEVVDPRIFPAERGSVETPMPFAETACRTDAGGQNLAASLRPLFLDEGEG